MEDKVLQSFVLSNLSNYWKLYADVYSRGNFTGAKVTRTWLDKETGEQTQRVFTFSANLSELKQVRSNLDLVINCLSKKQGM